MMFGQTNNTSTKIVDKYLKWKGASDGGFFIYYDKEAGEEKKYDLKDFVLIKIGYKIEGWSDTDNKAIYSNQIDNFKEEFSVKSGDRLIIKGVYRDIKEDIITAGGKLFLTITAISNGEIIQFGLKGTSYFNFNEMLRAVDINTNKIKFASVLDGKKGAVKYKTPVFEVGDIINDEEKDLANETVKTIIENKNKIENTETNDFGDKVIKKKEEISIEDIPF